MRSLFLTFILLLFVGEASLSQVADTVQMKEIEVISSRYQLPIHRQPAFIAGLDSVRLSTFSGNSVGDALTQFSSVFVRSNAPGAVSVASFRGLGGQQTRVLWEGMQINHSMLGLVDLSLLRAGAFSSVEVSSGSSSSGYGSGISGSVALKSSVNPKEISISQSLGSYGNFITDGKMGIGIGNWNIGIAGSYQTNENDYRYFDRSTRQEESRRHATYDNIQILTHAGWKNESRQFDSKFWFLKSDHEIPENVFTGPGTATQFDAAYRWLNSFRFRSGKFSHQIKTYLAQTELDYFDPNRNIESISTSREWNNEWESRYIFSEKLLMINVLSANLSEVETNNYNETKVRSVFSEQVAAEWSATEKFGIFPAARIERYNDFGWAFSPSIGLNYQIIPEEFYAQASVARNFRAPTFNDLYWPQGGNENLDPETAIKLEAGIGITNQLFGVGDHNLTVYRIDVSDGIRWTPGSTSMFTAQNYLSILSYGAEWAGSKMLDLGSSKLNLSNALSYSRSTIDESRFQGDQAVGDQLPYVPEWKYSATLSYSFRDFSFNVFSRWVSERFSTEQNELVAPQPAYSVTDVALSYKIGFQSARIITQLRINNLFDKRYEIVRLYPQPLRNFLLTTTINFN